jgi:hypothetical protein
MNAPTMPTFAIARDLLALGLSVIPVPRPDEQHDGKVPIIAWKEYQHRLPTDDELCRWFDHDSNIAVICGAISGVVVVDADSPDALQWIRRRLPYTPWQTKTARGFHLWYRHPGIRVGNRARLDTSDGKLAIDVRGDGGYVIAPGSIHTTGVLYERAGDWTVPREQLPRFWLGWLERLQRTSPASSASTQPPHTIGAVAIRARRYLAAIAPPEIGQGSDAATLYAACRLVRGFGLAPSDAEMLLWDWAGGRPDWTREWIAEKVAHAEQYGTEPIGALR